MNSSLDKLVKNLNDKDFKYLAEEFSGEQLKLVKETRFYPYEYRNSFKRFTENELPDKRKFISSLKDCGINEKEYERALNVWNVFKIKKLGQYHNLYLKTDVLLLCDVFEIFIDLCLDYYQLDPCHYFSSPGLNWDKMLKMTRIKLQKINNINMHIFIEKGKKGGISYILKRHSKIDDNKSIMYWVMNNLYGFAMNEPLPYSDFNLKKKKLKNLI